MPTKVMKHHYTSTSFLPPDTSKVVDAKHTLDKISPQIHKNNSRPTSDHAGDLDDLDLLDSSKVLTSARVQCQPVDSCRLS